MANHDPNPDGPIVDYARTQRVILLIDLNPLISLQNPTQFISSLLCSAKILLSFSQLASSLFAFKFFFTSLSPLLSSSKVLSMVPNSPISLSFDRPATILESLSQTLNSLISFDRESLKGCSAKASCLEASMRQLIHDYAWDPIIRDSETGMLLKCDPVGIRSNLIVLFSPICDSFESLSEFFNVGIDDDCFGNVSAFCEKFCGFFENVNKAFLRRDIQLSWVDVQCRIDGAGEKAESDESRLGYEFLQTGIRNLGWGFCSSDPIVLGSALVPFGLIYPKIAISPTSFHCDDSSKKLRVELCLDILDVAQKPLECKSCELELVDLNPLPRNRSNYNVLHVSERQNSRMLGSEMKNKFWGCFGDEVSKIQIKALYKRDEIGRLKGNLSDPILVREAPTKPSRDKLRKPEEFFADKVLRVISRELGESVPKNSAPIWQILLSFLYREGYRALVSVSNPSRNSLLGILEPFTVSLALLFIVHDGHEFIEASVAHFDTRTSNEAFQPVKCSESDTKRSKRKKNFKVLEDQTWSSFCYSAFEHSELELESVYFSKQYRNLKKLRFLKCWMKQITNYISDILILEEKLKPLKQDIRKDVDDRLTELQEETEQPVFSTSENREMFLSSLSNKIQQGIDCQAVELGALARRLVNSAISWLNRNHDLENATKSDDSTGELRKFLLKEPKDLIAKARRNDSSSQPPSLSASDRILREYELQILFRMEVLQSEAGERINESLKNKFVKQICSLLENIPCHLEGGFFGDWSLDNYVGKIIKSRYNDTLEDVVNRIYKKMDLIPFTADDDDNELPNSFLNSEEGNQNSREKPNRDELSVSFRISETESVEESLEPSNNGEETEEEHARKLLKAQERRVRARRFTSFTSWVPDLQKVWAPKQKKVEKPLSLPQRKTAKRKKEAEEVNDTVCETPENKQSYSHEKSHSCPSVSKKLFQDDP